MAGNKIVAFGPTPITAAATNMLNPPTLTGGVGLHGVNVNTYVILRHIRVTNKTNLPQNVASWLGATGASAAGSEMFFAGAATAGALNANTGVSVPANFYVDWWGYKRIEVADFITAVASLTASLIFEAEGEIGVV